MSKKIILALAMTVVLGWQSSAWAQTEPAKFIGTWQLEGDVSGYDELLDIKIIKGPQGQQQWLIQRAWTQGGVQRGAAIGVNPFFLDGKLKFTSKYVKKPVSFWQDNTEITAEIGVDGRLHYHGKGINNRVMKLLVPSTEAVLAVAKKYIGKWETMADGFKEVWEIEIEKGKLQIKMTYFDKEKEVGSAKGLNAGIVGEELKFLHKYTKKPKDDLADNAIGSLKVMGDKVQYAYNAGLVAGSRDLIKPGGPVVGNPNPNNPNPNNPNPELKADAKVFLGSWEGERDGFKEIWFVTNEGGQLTVKGYFVKGGEKLGAFTARNPVVADGKLVFVEEFGPMPTGAVWFNGATFTVTPGENSLSYSWALGASSGGPRTLSKRN